MSASETSVVVEPATGMSAKEMTVDPDPLAAAVTAAGAGFALDCPVPGSVTAFATNMPPPSAATASRVRVGAILVMLATRTAGPNGSVLHALNLFRLTDV